MKFQNQFNLFRTISYVATSMSRRVLQGGRTAIRKLRTMLGLRSVNQEINKQLKDAKKLTKEAKPKSLKDYFDFGAFYVSKIFVLVAFVVLVLAVVLFIKFGYPFLVQKFFTKDIYLSTDEMSGYSGKVRLLADDGTVIYVGKLEKGGKCQVSFDEVSKNLTFSF